MGTTRVRVILRIPGSPHVAYQAHFVVDTGATDCVVPASRLHAAGVQPVGTRVYQLADGSLHEYDVGVVQIELMGETIGGRVIFGPEDAEPILGVTALESIGAVLDPVRRELRRIPAIPLRRAAAIATTVVATA
jgi:clan AA aspartic protease